MRFDCKYYISSLLVLWGLGVVECGKSKQKSYGSDYLEELLAGDWIEIEVSPLRDGEVILHWKVSSFLEGDWVALYRGPLTSPPIFKRRLPGSSLNRIRTGVLIPSTGQAYPQLPTGKPTCLGAFQSAYWRLNRYRNCSSDDNALYKLVACSCVRTYPTWMGETRRWIGHLKIGQLLIPGTHDSAAYQTTPYHHTTESLIHKFIYTQDESVIGQLMFGIRYLDLRVARYNSGGYWTNHGLVALWPLQQILDQVKAFIDGPNQEIVILHFHGFPTGFKSNLDDLGLAKYLVKELDGYMVPPPDIGEWQVTLEEVWQRGEGRKRVIVAHARRSTLYHGYSAHFWPNIPHVWADTMDPRHLYKHIMKAGMTMSGDAWAAMAELTPDVWTAMRYRKGLREMADSVNGNITDWLYTSQWWATNINILAVDFFRSTGIVNAAIAVNLCRANTTTRLCPI